MLAVINKPVKLYFYPISVQAQFQKSIKFQIAILRSSTDENGKRVVKIDKTEPMRFTNPEEKISLSQTLSLLTTIPFNPQTKGFGNKQVEFEMALQIDGSKFRMGNKINLKEIVQYKGKLSKFVDQKSNVNLVYKAEVKFQDQEKSENGINQNAKRKIIRFDNSGKQERQELKEKNNEGGAKTDRVGSRYKTTAADMRGQNTQKVKQEAKVKQQKLLKSKSLNTIQAYQKDNTSIQGIIMTQNSEDKYKQLSNINTLLQSDKKALQKKIKQKDSKIQELIKQIEELSKKAQFDAKSDNAVKQLLKKEQTTRYNLEKDISQLKDQLKTYKKEIDKLSKTAINYQQSSKNIAFGSELQIKSLKDRIKQLQKSECESTNQVQKYFQKLKDKEEIISQLKNKILLLDKQNLELKLRIKEFEKKLSNQKQQYQLELEQLRENIKDIKQDNKNLKMPSSKQFKQDPTELRKKLEILEKQLQRKEELLKKMTQMKKVGQQDVANENSALKKQLSELKDIIDKLQSKRSEELSSTTSIEFRVQMQKMKKELQLCKKNQKALLIQKGKLQASNKQFQEDVVRGKQTIVNILNLVQQTGNESLISEAYSLME